MLLNVALVLLGGYQKATLIEQSLSEHGFISQAFWGRIYSVSTGRSCSCCLNASVKSHILHSVDAAMCLHVCCSACIQCQLTAGMRRTQILVVVLGQDLPDEASSTSQQVFALVVAAVGLAAFALVLALVEQVVLQILDDNVRRGSRVFEMGHVSTSGFHLSS